MFKKISISKRVNAILALSIVFLLVLATNRIDRKHFEVAQNSVKEVYNDRVVVQDYIFSISNALFYKRLALKDSLVKLQRLKENENIRTLLLNFKETKLTIAEARNFDKLQANFDRLIQLESQYSQPVKDTVVLKDKISQTLEAMQVNLKELSEIQIRESRDLTFNAQKSLDFSELLSNLEILFLIITGIAIQFILFYRVKKSR
ncbi:hypothetical protein [Leeuwenhoekiella sp. MAR_2009_132]|uniref:hypothetical protein n=1 Tax=Leeuwenhoekiella sp. MAR_2009_132 TaxID=1392489 RepID=UPI00048EA3A0|nr:hypothetical protein [Leeuwenhoekiella sp. MAR_2009_132]